MTPRIPLLALALVPVLLAGSGCASGARPHARFSLPAPAPMRWGARAEFEPAAFDEVFREAVHAVRARGFEILSCDPDRGAIATARAEVDAPCGGTSCLAREVAAVKLGHRAVRVTVTREVWDATVRAWRVPDDEVSSDTLSREEQELVVASVQRRSHPPAGYGDPCAPSDCEAGACLVASADAP